MSASDSDLSTDEQDALELIRSRGGIHQSDFWKEFNISLRKGSRLVESLQQAGFIEREDVVYKRRTTYYLKPAPRDLDFLCSWLAIWCLRLSVKRTWIHNLTPSHSGQ